MNYKRLIENLQYIAGNHKLVNSCEEGDNVYKVNHMDIVYPLVFITPQPHILNTPLAQYNFVIYYIDRLLDDKSNRVDIHNSAIKAINDIIFEVDELEVTESLKPINITVFSEKFADECAGGFIEISIETENDNSDCTSLYNNANQVFLETELTTEIITTEEENKITTE